jgi:murein L,D-transpeptidase YcbB/YkuD
MLSKDIVDATAAAAKESGIAPAALLAVVEIESAGKPYEADGKTPRFLFERHKFYSELEDHASAEKLAVAIQRGLAHQGWKRSTQYADQGTSAGRLSLLARAAEVDRECAYRACSWGLGQTMGFHAERLGYPNAVAMVEAMKEGGVRVQVDCMVKEILRNNLDRHLAKRNWAAFARGYNGPRYAENSYDTKLAKAYAKWVAVYPGDDDDDEVLPEADIIQFGDRGPLVEGYQKRLAELGYFVGSIDGVYGSLTRSAVLTFQQENSLKVDGKIGPMTRAALNRPNAKPMPVPADRATVTADDLAKAGSGTIIDSRAAGTAAKVIVTTSVVSGVQQTTDVLGTMQGWVGSLTSIRAVVDPLLAVLKWCLGNVWIFAIVAGVIVLQKTNAIQKARVLAHRIGAHLAR